MFIPCRRLAYNFLAAQNVPTDRFRGGVFGFDTSVSAERCQFHENRGGSEITSQGGGTLATRGSSTINVTTELNECQFNRNIANGVDGVGGAMEILVGDFILTNSGLAGKNASNDGGGIFLFNTATVNFKNTTFRDNVSRTACSNVGFGTMPLTLIFH